MENLKPVLQVQTKYISSLGICQGGNADIDVTRLKWLYHSLLVYISSSTSLYSTPIYFVTYLYFSLVYWVFYIDVLKIELYDKE